MFDADEVRRRTARTALRPFTRTCFETGDEACGLALFPTTIDFEDGRRLVVRYTDQDHQAWVHATPASRRIITDRLKRLT
ncbi:hypothetical protein [Lentzea jiangxiensis]|uniref:Uncharacterized protein n=1 Tax=Lentzea jiangxiensis TaxID=641025 RepID=A0A1H0TJZ1_9PSEU|nr:hypothetical protein [Lentzea jiangxiensis]SDP54151.1 hypothetical protein SAMN05421507_11051 [Lentzea jiangxiensis]